MPLSVLAIRALGRDAYLPLANITRDQTQNIKTQDKSGNLRICVKCKEVIIKFLPFPEQPGKEVMQSKHKNRSPKPREFIKH
jgi:hypothetical protein